MSVSSHRLGNTLGRVAAALSGLVLAGAVAVRVVRPTATPEADPPSDGPKTALVGPEGMIPESAITWIDGAPTVFVVERELHLLVATPITIAANLGTDERRVDGLAAGQQVLLAPVASVEQGFAR
ncbi:MAG TPA: hypothetical protein VHE30_24735 [Polyangiaceae bacterium]|nr:hypothetical protein [Polyangiaceae bacterium]